jgi:hypothetical protein
MSKVLSRDKHGRGISSNSSGTKSMMGISSPQVSVNINIYFQYTFIIQIKVNKKVADVH